MTDNNAKRVHKFAAAIHACALEWYCAEDGEELSTMGAAAKAYRRLSMMDMDIVAEIVAYTTAATLMSAGEELQGTPDEYLSQLNEEAQVLPETRHKNQHHEAMVKHLNACLSLNM